MFALDFQEFLRLGIDSLNEVNEMPLHWMKRL